MKRTQLLLPLLLVLGLFTGCSSQESLSGTVTLNGTPVPAATVIATTADGTEHAATTSADGTYQLTGLPPGKVQFRFQPSPKATTKRPADPKTPAPTTPVVAPPALPDKYTRATPELAVQFTGGSQRFDLPLTQ